LNSITRTLVRQYLQGAEMIQLATDPNASRNWRPAAAEAKEANLANRRSRSGHAWPFISRYAERTSVPQEPKRVPSSDSGS
jgi:hypothetical protein